MSKEEKKFEVFTPNKEYNGVRNGVLFTKGKGTATKEEALELVATWGYSCPDLVPEAPEEDVIKLPAKNATNKKLQAFMTKQDIPFESDDNKSDLWLKIDAWIEEGIAAEEAEEETTS
ncbi:MAG: hypothetical protein RLN90_09565 [Balneolaceae bacterium]